TEERTAHDQEDSQKLAVHFIHEVTLRDTKYVKLSRRVAARSLARIRATAPFIAQHRRPAAPPAPLSDGTTACRQSSDRGRGRGDNARGVGARVAEAGRRREVR